MPVYNTWQRPRTREDGWPTRSDIRYDSDAERMCRVLVGLVEDMGASESLTRAVTLLSKARDAIADHVERIDFTPVDQPVPPTEPGEQATHNCVPEGCSECRPGPSEHGEEQR